MPHRSSTKRSAAAAAAKESPALAKARKLTPESKQQLVPLSDVEENRVSNPELLSITVEENKDQESVPSSAAKDQEREKVSLPSAYVKEIKPEAEDSMSNVPEVKGVDEEKQIKQEPEILTTNAPGGAHMNLNPASIKGDLIDWVEQIDVENYHSLEELQALYDELEKLRNCALKRLSAISKDTNNNRK